MAIAEACSLVDIWIEPKYIIPAFMVFISSGLLPFLLHKYKMHRERAEKLFDTRKQEYQEYFKRMEDAARLTAQDYDEYLSVTLPNASRNLYESGSSPEAMVEYQKVMNDFTKGINQGFQKATTELTSLRIVCTPSLATLLDDFEKQYTNLMGMQPQMLKEIKESMTPEAFVTGDFNFETPTKVIMIDLGNKIKQTRDNIIALMRSELGYES
ncbi:hypothetical protein [Psychromonas ingrahamii]|nr:hypothetical protein [Psychromonas ingrahamii]